MHKLVIGTAVILSVLFASCNNTEKEIVGSWKRTQVLDDRDEPVSDNKHGYILDLNEDMTFNLRFTYGDRPAFGGSKERNRKGTWALAEPTMKDDLSALVLRIEEHNAIREETHRVRTLKNDELKLIFSNHTQIFQRR